MKPRRSTLTISYRVLDPSGKVLEVHKETGLNKNYLKWKAERYVSKKYGKGVKLHQFKVEEIP